MVFIWTILGVLSKESYLAANCSLYVIGKIIVRIALNMNDKTFKVTLLYTYLLGKYNICMYALACVLAYHQSINICCWCLLYPNVFITLRIAFSPRTPTYIVHRIFSIVHTECPLQFLKNNPPVRLCVIQEAFFDLV